ncbi:MAG: ATP-binding protein [Planctomycetes bacterium]|nr:ATP-binding protein [Planctomycetota bacterium]
MGYAAVGRPSNCQGAELLAELLRDRDILVVGENDTKPDGKWPGRDGAERTARRIATEWGEPVEWTLPPEPAKDIRSWLGDCVSQGLDLSDNEACQTAGIDLLEKLNETARQICPEKKPPQSELLVRLALELYRIGLDEAGDPFAVERDGPNIALMLKGSRDALRSTLAREFRRRSGTTPNASALSDALTVLQGEAQECTPEPVLLRVARHGDGIVLDLGRKDGCVVLVRPGAWEVVDTSPVLFRRTALSGELPVPQRGGGLSLLRELLNVNDESWPLTLGWLVAALIPEIPHPILMLGGLHGTGKSTAARMLVGIFDPSAAPLRSQPREPEQWAIAAAGSWAVVIDNVSTIPAWWSDALCKAVTGDGWIRRKLYTDSDLSVLSFRRVIALTSIDAGALRGDLGDRLLLMELEEIDDVRRKDEVQLIEMFRERRPLILGAVLDVLANVLHELPGIELTVRPRMADFGRVQAAVDAVMGTDGLSRFLGQRERIASDVLEGDPVALAVIMLMEGTAHWDGSPTDLHERLTPEKAQRDWPRNGSAMSGRLKRLAPALKTVGIEVTHTRDSSRNRRRLIHIRKPTRYDGRPSAAIAEPDANEGNVDCAPHDHRTRSDGMTYSAPSDTNVALGVESPGITAISDASDASDGKSPDPSGREVLDL